MSRVRDLADNNIVFVDGISTLDITENNNLFFTNARADARIGLKMIDEDNMSSNSSAHMPTQQSVKSYVDTEVSGLVDTAPGTLDTLNELAAALGDDANFATTVTNSIATKLPKAGGTMTGGLTVQSSTGQLRLQGTSNTNKNVSIFYNESGDYGQINVDESGVNQKDLWVTGLNLKFGRNTSSEAMRIDSSGNVGIGTDSPNTALEIAGGQIWVRQDSGSSTGRGLQFGYAGNHGSYRSAIKGGPESYGVTDSGILTFHTQNGYVVSDTPPERMRIDSSGNVGIGTTDPVGKLDVSTTNSVGSVFRKDFNGPVSNASSKVAVTLWGQDHDDADVGTGTDQFGPMLGFGARIDDGNPNSGDIRAGISYSYNGDLTFHAKAGASVADGSYERIRIDGVSGSVGIDHDAPVKKLSVNVGADQDGIFLYSNKTQIASLSRTTVSSTVVTSLDGNTGRDIYIGGTINTDVILGYAGGNVGIGTSSPAGLQSWAKGTRILDLKLETTPVTGDVGVQFRANTGAYLGLAAGGGTGIGIVIDSNNKVGIGTTSPAEKLEIKDYKDGTGNNINGIGLLLSSTASSTGSNSANGGTGIEFAGYGHNYNGAATGVAGSNPIAIRINPVYEYWGQNNSMSNYGQTYPYLKFDFKNSNNVNYITPLLVSGLSNGRVAIGNDTTSVSHRLSLGSDAKPINYRVSGSGGHAIADGTYEENARSFSLGGGDSVSITEGTVSNSNKWRVRFEGDFGNNYQGGGLNFPAAQIYVTNTQPTVYIGSTNITVSRDGSTGKLIATNQNGSYAVHFTGKITVWDHPQSNRPTFDSEMQAISLQGTDDYGTNLYGGLIMKTPAYSEYHFQWSGQQNHSLTFTCASYQMSTMEYTSHQTNGGSDIHKYVFGKWGNNHTSHNWNQMESNGSTWGLTTTFTATDQSGGSSQANGKLVINETYSGGSVSTRTLVVKTYYGGWGLTFA